MNLKKNFYLILWVIFFLKSKFEKLKLFEKLFGLEMIKMPCKKEAVLSMRSISKKQTFRTID